MRDQDLRTNPSEEGGDDVNPGVQHQVIPCHRGPWVDWGRREGTMHDKWPSQGRGLFQTSIWTSRWCPNAYPIQPSSSSLKELRVGTSHAPIGVQMSEIRTPERTPDPGARSSDKRPTRALWLSLVTSPDRVPESGDVKGAERPAGRHVLNMILSYFSLFYLALFASCINTHF